MAGGTACAARIGGGVQCWNTADGLTAPETATGLVDVRQLATNDAWVCALGGDGSVSCWGHDGRTGFGPTPVPRVNNVIGINVGTFVDSHACAILGDGTVQCWDFPNPVPGPLAGITGAVEFSSGTGDHMCALERDGSVACWGNNQGGQLGSGDTLEHADPVIVTGLARVKALAVSESHTGALLDDGSVVCWGVCGSAIALEPAAVPNLHGTVDLGSGTDFNNCVRTIDGHARCACLGVTEAFVGVSNCDFAFLPVPDLDQVTYVTEGAFGVACAARADSSVWCWSPMFPDGQPSSSNLPLGEPVRIPLTL